MAGRSPEDLSLEERRALAGSWIALELYSPQTVPLKQIRAIAGSVAECAAALRREGLDPAKFEYTMLKQPY